jgi:hypothetical protein
MGRYLLNRLKFGEILSSFEMFHFNRSGNLFFESNLTATVLCCGAHALASGSLPLRLHCSMGHPSVTLAFLCLGTDRVPVRTTARPKPSPTPCRRMASSPPGPPPLPHPATAPAPSLPPSPHLFRTWPHEQHPLHPISPCPTACAGVSHNQRHFHCARAIFTRPR